MESSNERNNIGYWEERLINTSQQTLLSIYDGLSLGLTSIGVYINSLEEGSERDIHVIAVEELLGVEGSDVLAFFEEVGLDPVNLDTDGNEYIDDYDDEFSEKEDEIFKYSGLYEFKEFLHFYLGCEYEGEFYSEPNKKIDF